MVVDGPRREIPRDKPLDDEVEQVRRIELMDKLGELEVLENLPCLLFNFAGLMPMKTLGKRPRAAASAATMAVVQVTTPRPGRKMSSRGAQGFMVAWRPR